MEIDYTVPKLTSQIERMNHEVVKLENSLPYLSGKQYFEAEQKINETKIQIDKANEELMKVMAGNKEVKEVKEVEKVVSKFEQLMDINVNEHKEGRNGFDYLTWSWAWAEFKKRCPDATYTIFKNENNLPYVFDANTGYMVYTTVTTDNVTHEMWLPVMDGKNKAMKSEAYTYKDRYGKELRVEAATMFDINKTIMRCLVKNLAMFGLGLYIYAGEDLPECEAVEKKEEESKKDTITEVMAKALFKKAEGNAKIIDKILELYKVQDIKDMTMTQYSNVNQNWEKLLEKVNEK